MELIMAMFITLVMVLLIRNPLKRWPVLFYVLAVIVDVLYLSGVIAKLSLGFYLALQPYLQRCWFAFWLLTLVMFIGVLPDHAKIRNYLMPVRGNLSILAAIICACHFIGYLSSYFERLFSGFMGMTTTTAVSFMVSWVLIGLLALLAVTSFTFIRSHIRTDTWKKLQKLAYPFYILVFAHILLLLMPSAVLGGSSLVSTLVYVVIFVLYVVLRIAKLLTKANNQVPSQRNLIEKVHVP